MPRVRGRLQRQYLEYSASGHDLINKVKPQKKEKNPTARTRGADLRVLPWEDDGDGDKVLESLESLLDVALRQQGAERTTQFLVGVTERLRAAGVDAPRLISTP